MEDYDRFVHGDPDYSPGFYALVLAAITLLLYFLV